ncbi:MAG: hypothetical protein V3R98_00180 [Alphaproteobacteria bacterium]
MINQQQTERLDRTFTVPESDTFAGSFLLPIDTVRASKFLAFDSTGAPIAAVGTTPTTTPVSAFMVPVLAAVDAAAVRTLLATPDILEVQAFS